jgi:hypothetical protein
MSNLSSSACSEWSLHEWNARLVAGTLLTPDANGLFEPLYSINFGPLSFYRYVGLEPSASETGFKLFENSLRSHVLKGGYDFDSDAYRLRGDWKTASETVPPYWSHLVYSCYVAATMESTEEDFRRRLMALLRIEGYPPLADLPKLWRDVAAWSGQRSEKLKDCRKVILAGDWRVRIGYSYNFAFPKRQDNRTMLDILKAENFMGVEPPVMPVMRALEKHRFRFSGEFNGAFDNCRGLYNRSGRVDRFWAVIREAALFGKVRQSSSLRWGAILRVIRGQADLTIVADEQNGTNDWQTLEGSFAEIGLLTVTLGSPDESGARIAAATIIKGTGLPAQGAALASLFKLGVVIFSFETIGTYKACFSWPQDGPLALLFAPQYVTMMSSLLGKPSPTKDLGGLFLFEGVSISELRDIAKRLPNVFLIGPLAATAPPTRISVNDGYWADSGRSVYLGLPELLPWVTVEGADRITALSLDGDEIRLEKSEDGWRFPKAELSGEIVLTAYSGTEALAARHLHFRLNHSGVPQIRKPKESAAFWTMSSSGASVSATALYKEWEQDEEKIPDFTSYGVKETQSGRPFLDFRSLHLTQSSISLALSEALASVLSHRQCITIPEAEALFTHCLSALPVPLWSILHEWQAAGCLYVLRQKRWRGTKVFGVNPHLRVYRLGGRTRAITSGLFTSEMFARILAQTEHDLRARQLEPKCMFSPAQLEFEASTLSQMQAIADILLIPIRPIVDDTSFSSGTPLNITDGEISPPQSNSTATWSADLSILEPEMSLELHQSPSLPNRYVVVRKSGKRIAFLTRFGALSAVYQLTRMNLVQRLSQGLFSTISAGTRLPASAAAIGHIFGSQRIEADDEISRDSIIDFGTDALAREVLGPLMSRGYEEVLTAQDEFTSMLSISGKTVILTDGVSTARLCTRALRVSSTIAIPWLLHRKRTVRRS